MFTRRSSITVLTIGFLIAAISLWSFEINAAVEATPNRPFPQHIAYAGAQIRPNNFTQDQQDQHVRDFYDDWKSKYLVSTGTNGAGQTMQRVAFGQGSSVTVSEGQGYGMVVTALMAGHDANAQTLFDGLFRFARNYPSGIDSRLMSWKIDNGNIVSGNDSAFDGDADIAYGLLLADAQWGSDGAINYKAEADQVIAGILDATIGADSLLPKLGDWTSDNGSPYSQYTPRASDFMPAHFHAFGRATNDATWDSVVDNSQAVIDSIQTNYSASTGLLPDFIINCNPIANCEPANNSFLEGAHDGHYYYNSGRVPWRVGLDALLNGDAASTAQVQKITSWLAGNTGGNVNNIKAGYQLDGTPIGNYFTTYFVAPFGVAAMMDGSQQDFLNDIYASVYNTHEDYFEDSVNLLALLAMTGNYWDPTEMVAPQKEIVAYFAQWGIYGRNYHVKDIVTSGSAEKITILNYAFGHVVDNECIMVTQTGVMDTWADYEKAYTADLSVDGVADTWDQPLKGNFNQLKKLKAQYPHIKIMISLGGWTWSEDMSDAALTEASRQQTAASCIDLYIKGNLPNGDGVAAGIFDGIDIDWEYPAIAGNTQNFRPEDTQNFTLLLAEFRRQLDEIDPDLLLTVATGAGVDKYELLELDKIGDYLDYVNIMTYDFHGAWDATTNHQAALYGSVNDPSTYPASEYNVDSAVQGYLDGGVSAEKIIIGVPFYGRGWTGVTNINNGLYQAATGAANGVYEAGFEDYKVLKNAPGTIYRDPITKAMWKYDGNNLWSYDDEIVLADKMAYVHQHRLAGAMVWSLDGDDSNGTLMTALNDALNSGTTPIPPTTTPEPTTTPPTATPVIGCTAPAWNASSIYVENDVVSHNNRQWRAKWWTQGDTPGTTGQYGVWDDLGACGASTPSPTPTSTPSPSATPTETATPVVSPTPSATPVPNSASISIDDYSGSTDEQFTVSVTGQDFSGVGAVNLHVSYDATVVTLVDCQADAADAFDLATCTLDADNSQINLSLVDTDGVSADVELLSITFNIIGNETDVSPLDITLNTFSSVQGQALSASVEDGSVIVVPPVMTGDVNCDDSRDVIDALFVLQYTVAARSAETSCTTLANGLYLPACDVNGDTLCDAVDASFLLQCTVGVSNMLCPANRGVIIDD